MGKRGVLILFVLICLPLFSSCNEFTSIINESITSKSGEGGIIVSEGTKADARMEQIVSAIKDNNSEALKSLFSDKAVGAVSDFDSEICDLFDFLQGEIASWERDGFASDESTEYGKKSLMIRYGVNVNTADEAYRFFVIDYNTDTIDPDNEGVYMIEVRLADSENTGAWQDRMRAGIYIH